MVNGLEVLFLYLYLMFCDADHVWGVILCGHIRQGTLHGWRNTQWCPSALVSTWTIIAQVKLSEFSRKLFVHSNRSCHTVGIKWCQHASTICSLSAQRRILEKLIIAHLLKKFPALYGILFVHYHVHSIPQLCWVMGQTNAVRSFISVSVMSLTLLPYHMFLHLQSNYYWLQGIIMYDNGVTSRSITLIQNFITVGHLFQKLKRRTYTHGQHGDLIRLFSFLTLWNQRRKNVG
jgi:hypothetical protein